MTIANMVHSRPATANGKNGSRKHASSARVRRLRHQTTSHPSGHSANELTRSGTLAALSPGLISNQNTQNTSASSAPASPRCVRGPKAGQVAPSPPRCPGQRAVSDCLEETGDVLVEIWVGA